MDTGTFGTCTNALCRTSCKVLFLTVITITATVWVPIDADTYCSPNRGQASQHRTDINECNSSPCQNGGTCTDHLNYYTCRCWTGFSGDRCQINIDECTSQPCQHQSPCIDMINGYKCQCVDGYTGPTCSHEINECDSGTCKNGALCHDRVNAYACDCLPGFTGSRCESDIDECASGPCENGATCQDRINGYTCGCRSGYEGSNCEHHINEITVNQVSMAIGGIIILIAVIWFFFLGCKMLYRALMDKFYKIHKYKPIKNND